jgi:RimJ/RimL family protein N-acetyltransferase
MTTARTVLRRITADDAAGWKSFNNAIAKRTPWPCVPSIIYARNEILNYDEMWVRGERYAYIIIEKKTGAVIGDFHFKSINSRLRTAEFGHALHPRVWGTGITYETLDVARNAARRAGLKLWAKVEERNIRSWKSLEKYKARFKGTRAVLQDGKRTKMRFYELA